MLSSNGTAITAKENTGPDVRMGNLVIKQSESGKTVSIRLAQTGIPIYEIAMKIFNQNPPSARDYYVTIDMDERSEALVGYNSTYYWDIYDGSIIDVDLQGVTECELDFPGMDVIDLDNGEIRPPYRIADRDYRRLLVNADSDEPYSFEIRLGNS